MTGLKQTKDSILFNLKTADEIIESEKKEEKISKIASFCMEFLYNNTEAIVGINPGLSIKKLEEVQFHLFKLGLALAKFDSLYPALPSFDNFKELLYATNALKSEGLKIKLVWNNNAKESHEWLIDFIDKRL